MKRQTIPQRSIENSAQIRFEQSTFRFYTDQDKSTLLAASKPLILTDFAKSFDDTRTKEKVFALPLFLFAQVWIFSVYIAIMIFVRKESCLPAVRTEIERTEGSYGGTGDQLSMSRVWRPASV